MPRDGIVSRSIPITLIAFLVAGIGVLAYTWYSTAARAAQNVEIRLARIEKLVPELEHHLAPR